MPESSQQPWVLLIGGHDPTGGAGIQADMETVISFGCRPASVITCLTRQDSHTVHGISPLEPDSVIANLDCLLDDFGTPDAIKTGLIGDAELIKRLADRLSGIDCPIVVDPVLATGGGRDLASEAIIHTMRETLLPVATIATPNLDELQRLVPDSEYTDKQAEVLLAEGCGQLLVTGGDADTDRIENVHFAPASTRQSFQWARIQGPREGRFHGTGCTLASAIAALLAKGEDMRSALRWAQTFVAHTLESAVTPGNGQAFPNRLFSIDGN